MSCRNSIAALACALAGCGSVTSYQSADTLPRGDWQAMAALGTGTYTDTPQDTRTPTVTGELGARVGVADHTDVGLKLFALGIEASVRQRVLHGSTWSIALLGAVNYGKTETQILAQARLGGVATRRYSPTFSLSAGLATTGSLFVPAGGGDATGVLLGAYGSLDWRMTSRWHLVPELSLHRSLQGDVPVDGNVAQLGVAVLRDL